MRINPHTLEVQDEFFQWLTHCLIPKKRIVYSAMTAFPFHGRSLVADASSLIYLARSSLIHPFARTFSVTVPSLVYQECVQNGYPGSDLIRALQQEGGLCVRPVREDTFPPMALPEGGEGEVITLYY